MYAIILYKKNLKNIKYLHTNREVVLFEKITNLKKNQNNNFITIQRNLHLKKYNYIDKNQLDYELSLYNKKTNKNEKIFNIIFLSIQNSLIYTKIYSKEK